MHNLGLRDLAFLSGGVASGGSGGGGGGSGGTSPLTLGDFDAYWRMNRGWEASTAPSPYCSQEDRTGNGHHLYKFGGVDDTGPGCVFPPGGPGERIPGHDGAYCVLGLGSDNIHDGGYESMNLYLRSWLGSGSPPSGGAYPMLESTDSYTMVFFFRTPPGQRGRLFAYNQEGDGIWSFAMGYPVLGLADDTWHLVVLGRNVAGGVFFTSIDGAAMETQPDDGHTLGYFAFLPDSDVPGDPGDDGEYADHEVYNPQLDAAGLMLRAITQEEINWLWDGSTGREL